MVHQPGEPLWASTATPAELGAFVAELRRRSGFTQASLADSAEVTRRFVNELEGGQATLFMRRLYAVLDALDARLVVEQRGARETPTTHTGAARPGVSVTLTTADQARASEPAPHPEPALKELGW